MNSLLSMLSRKSLLDHLVQLVLSDSVVDGAENVAQSCRGDVAEALERCLCVKGKRSKTTLTSLSYSRNASRSSSSIFALSSPLLTKVATIAANSSNSISPEPKSEGEHLLRKNVSTVRVELFDELLQVALLKCLTHCAENLADL